ncbi:MAG: hypothetical protein JKY89_04395 [Immundisolibacteraceae bacterium]|nr:hypothetical protein [Immundisolibacteraceae bacterium]
MSNQNSDTGLSTPQFALLTALAVITLVLAGFNVMAQSANAGERQKFAERQQYIAQTAKLRKVGAELIKTTAQVAVQTQDKQLTEMLSKFGFTIKSNNTEAGAAE